MRAALAAAAAVLLQRSGTDLESQVCGSSMHPTLPDGSRIRIRCGDAAFGVGDIVVLVAEPPVVHRVVGVARRRGELFVVTRGDAIWFCDMPVTRSGVLGVVQGCDTGDGWRAVGPPPPFGGLGTVVRGISYGLIRGALAIDARLALLTARAGGVFGAWATRVLR